MHWEVLQLKWSVTYTVYNVQNALQTFLLTCLIGAKMTQIRNCQITGTK